MFKLLKVWWLRSQVERDIKCLVYFLENSAFDLSVSTHDYRRKLISLRERIKANRCKLAALGCITLDPDL